MRPTFLRIHHPNPFKGERAQAIRNVLAFQGGAAHTHTHKLRDPKVNGQQHPSRVYECNVAESGKIRIKLNRLHYVGVVPHARACASTFIKCIRNAIKWNWYRRYVRNVAFAQIRLHIFLCARHRPTAARRLLWPYVSQFIPFTCIAYLSDDFVCFYPVLSCWMCLCANIDETMISA